MALNNVVKQQIIDEALVYWNADRLTEAGKTIFERIPVALRHFWAADVLQLASERFPRLVEVDAVLEFAATPDKWGHGKEGRYDQAHRLVDAVNWHDSLILRLATQVGKVVYTAQQYPAPFDHNAGWKIAKILKQIVQQVDDVTFEKAAWVALSGEQYLALEKPVMCHPGCPVCYANGLVPER